MRFWLGIGVSLAFLALLLQQLDTDQVLYWLGKANPLPLLLALVLLAADFLLRNLRWCFLLRHFNPTLRPRDTLGPFFAGFALNNVLPLRAGDVIRAFAFTDELKASSGHIAGTLVVERILDLSALLSLLLLTLAVLPLPQLDWMRGETTVLLVVLLLLMIVLITRPEPWRRLLQALPLGEGHLRHFSDHLMEGLTSVVSLRAWVVLYATSLLVWCLEGGIYLCTVLAITEIGAWLTPWFALSVASLSTLLPSSPGYIGTFDYFATQALVSGGLQKEAAASAAILIHLILWLPITLAGGAYLLRHWGSGAWRRLNKQRRQEL